MPHHDEPAQAQRRGAGRGETSIEVYRSLPGEKAMQDAIVAAVVARHGRAWHLRDARQAPEMVDLPDLLILLPGVAMMWEVKSQRRTITTGQRVVADLLGRCDRFVGGIVRPVPKSDDEWSYDEVLALIEQIESEDAA
jgi:hypothetical protein